MARICDAGTASASGMATSPIRTTWLMHLDLEGGEQLPGQARGGDAGGRFARARAFEHVANVLELVLQRAGEIRVPGARPGDGRPVRAGGIGRRLWRDRHRALPVLPVLVRDEQGDGAARRATAADARQDFGSIRLDRHPPARGRSRPGGAAVALSMASGSIGTPAGIPSRIATSACPCDSPAVRNRSIGGHSIRTFCGVW